MISTPDTVDLSDIEQAAKVLSEKGKTSSVQQVKMQEFEFASCIQMLHLGAYEDEHRTIEQMLAFATEQKLLPTKEHCEVYISDPRRVPAERLKTILRMPVK
jgi:hypothetical protein